MKLFFAYSLVVIGIPILAGYIFRLICSMPISLIIGRSRGSEKITVRDHIAHVCLDLFSGFGAILTAGLLFHLFGLRPGLAVLGIVALWEVVISFAQPTQAKSQNRLDFSGWGVVFGWLVVLWLFSAN